MPPRDVSKPSLKRKQPSGADGKAPAESASRRDHKRAKTRDARQIAVQTTDKALRDGELDVDKFVKAREWEIRALEASMRGSRYVKTSWTGNVISNMAFSTLSF